MAESQHDDLADALARMADGDIAPSEHEPQAPPPTPPPPRAVKPASARPATVKPASAPVAKAPAPTPAAARPAAPARAARPAAPTVRQPAPPPAAAPATTAPMAIPPSARRARPAAPTTQNAPEIDGGQSTGLSNNAGDGAVIDDDDAVIVPPPDPSVFEYPSKSTADMRAKVARQKSIDFRRTLIPILLTCGVLLIAFASLKFVSGPDSVLTDLNIGIPIAFFVMAIILLALAVVNMISVKKQMENS